MAVILDVKVKRGAWPWWEWRVRFNSENTVWEQTGSRVGRQRAARKAEKVARELRDPVYGADWVDVPIGDDDA